MRLVIAGSRQIRADTADNLVFAAMARWGVTPTVVLSGTATGIDEAGERWAEARGIPIERYPADWKTHGRKAGPLRNRQMAEAADAALVIWDGVSRGSKNMLSEAKKRKLALVEVVVWLSTGKAVYMIHRAAS